MFDNTPNTLESAHAQRDKTNSFYEQVNISGSNLIIYHDDSGSLTADNISVWAAKYSLGGSSSFNGNRPITRNDPNFVGLNVGGNTVVDFLNDFFFPTSSAVISINSGVSYYEVGSAPTIPVFGTLTPNDSKTFGTGSVWRDDMNWYPFSGVSYSTTDVGITNNHTYEAFYQVDGRLINSSVKTVDLIYPFFYGLCPTAGLKENILYTTLTKDVRPIGNEGYAFTGTDTYIYFAYPNSYADLMQVLDPNLFQVLSSFEYSASVPITSSGLLINWSSSYKVYKWRTLADFTGESYQFQFS